VATVTYDKQITGHLVIDPYNDFISEGGGALHCDIFLAESVVIDPKPSLAGRELRRTAPPESRYRSDWCGGRSFHAPLAYEPKLAHDTLASTWSDRSRGVKR
jgi:hypothetical protein